MTENEKTKDGDQASQNILVAFLIKAIKIFFELLFAMVEKLFEIISLFFPTPDKEDVIKADLLNSDAVKSKVQADLSNHENGIYAGQISSNHGGKKVFIESSDRACVIGPPGTGKTTFLVNQIYHWAETQNSFVCLDVKPEIHEITRAKLEAKGYKCIVYNPTSNKDKYNFLGDLKTEESVGEIASAFIASENDNNPVFTETARDLLDAIIKHLKTPTKKEPEPLPSLANVYDFVTEFDSLKSLLARLSQSNSDDVRRITRTLKIMADNDRLLGSIFATFVSNMRFLRYQSIRDSLGADGFSLDELLKPKVALFLQFEEAQKETTAKLFSVMVGHLLRFMIINHQNRKPVLLFLDEIGNAGKIHDLTGKLNTIRSRQLPTWLYWQSTEQMQKYGQQANEGANVILGACDMHMCFRLNDNATAKWFAEKIGTQRVTKISATDGENSSNTKSIDSEFVIEPHEIQQLKMGMALYSYQGKNWMGYAKPYYQEEKENEQLQTTVN